MQENQISHVFWKPKNDEEVRNLIEIAIPKSTHAVTNMFPPFVVSVSVLIIN